MRHMRAGYRLGRTTAHRLATFRNLTVSLLEHGQIVTTVTKAKAVQPFVEKIITLAKRGDLHARRNVIAKLGWDRRGFDWMWLPKNPSDEEKAAVEKLADRARKYFNIPDSEQVERNRYGEIRTSPKIVKHLFTNVAPRFKDRAGGYTRVVKLGKNRPGDGAELALLQFVGAEEGPEIGGRVSNRRRTADKRTAYAAKVRKELASKADAGKSA
jgi:large subunit ribosomal protein L17